MCCLLQGCAAPGVTGPRRQQTVARLAPGERHQGVARCSSRQGQPARRHQQQPAACARCFRCPAGPAAAAGDAADHACARLGGTEEGPLLHMQQACQASAAPPPEQTPGQDQAKTLLVESICSTLLSCQSGPVQALSPGGFSQPTSASTLVSRFHA